MTFGVTWCDSGQCQGMSGDVGVSFLGRPDRDLERSRGLSRTRVS